MCRLSLALLCSALLFRSCDTGDLPPPQIASPLLVVNNPTLTTVALQKPICVFDGIINGAGPYKVRLLGVAASAPSMDPTRKDSFRATNGGKTGPYLAALFDVPNCSLVSTSDPTQPDFLGQYLFRVGDNVTCLNDPNFQGICNPPLSANTVYRFLYALEKAGTLSNTTLWSDPITTKTVRESATIDTWPGRRSGGMIVITSILSVLIFFLLTGFVAAVVSNVLGVTSGIETTRHETQTTQQAVPKAQASSDSSAVTGPTMERERYATKLQA